LNTSSHHTCNTGEMGIDNLQKIWWNQAQTPQLHACWGLDDLHCAINTLSLNWILTSFSLESFLHIWVVFYETWRTIYMFMLQDSIFLQGHLASDVDKIIANVYVSSNWTLELIWDLLYQQEGHFFFSKHIQTKYSSPKEKMPRFDLRGPCQWQSCSK
jgi:hypothetical protein